MSMGRFSIMRSSGFDCLSSLVGGQLEIAFDGYCHEPPGMVVIRSIIISFVEFVESNAEATPKNPAFQIRFRLFYDQVVAKSKALRAYTEGGIKIRHNDLLR